VVIWITGLSGAGKSAIAAEVRRRLVLAGRPTVLLDGDEVRNAIADGAAGYDRAGRLANARRVARLARLFETQDLVVVVATMSLFHEVHDWNRTAFRRYREVLVDVRVETLARRDPKGLYARAAAGAPTSLPGVAIAAELPRNPDLVIPNDVDDPRFAELAAERIVALL
jgi:adenylylsulfate kinase-like enzyme